MKRVAFAFGLMLLLSSLAAGQAPGTNADTPTAGKADPSPPVAGDRVPFDSAQDKRDDSGRAPKPIAVDEAFAETLENHNWALREITRIEGLSGQVEIPVPLRELRKQVDAKRAKMRAWMAEHKVPEGWLLYDDGEKKFFGPPASAEATAGRPGAPKAEK